MSEPDERKPLEAYLKRVGHTTRPFTDAYAYLLTARWHVVVGLAFASYITVNLGFAWLYWTVPGSIANTDGSYLEAFFFSIQTFAAIGYGFMYSQGLWGNSLVVIEAFVSLFTIALLTGIVFAKFSRPRARVLFSRNACVQARDGVPTLTFRLANERGNDVVEASIRVSVLKTELTKEGHRLRRFYDLRLQRESTPVFLLSWQVFHTIEEDSPLHGLTREDMLREDVRITIALTGLDGTFAQTIHARHLYWGEDVLFGHHFVDVMENHDDGTVVMHFERFHDTVAEDAGEDGPGAESP